MQFNLIWYNFISNKRYLILDNNKVDIENCLILPPLNFVVLLGGGREWIELAQDRDKWRAVLSAEINYQVL